MSEIANQPASSTFLFSTGQLVRAQAIAGILFSVFLVLHLSNTMLAVFGIDVYNDYQQIMQVFYQHPIVEMTIIGIPLVLHAIIGVILLYRRRKQKQKVFRHLHSWAGIFLLLFVFGHVAATRGVTLYAGAVPGFSGVSFSLWWMPAYFYPYYFILFMAGFYHAYNGYSMAYPRLTRKPIPAYFTRVRRVVMAVGAVFVIGALLAFDGRLFDVPNPVDNDYARAYAKILNIDLGTDE